jgi:hypothetical protein
LDIQVYRRVLGDNRIGGEEMLLFLAGLFCGSFVTIIIMSLMFAAKKGDQHLEEYLDENYIEQDDKK